MAVDELPDNEFIVKVRRGRIDRPVYMKRKAVMIFNRDQKDITFSYDNCCVILKAKLISQMPWSPPRGCTLRFISDARNDEEMVLEFESHEKLIDAFSILKNKYLERSQFVFSSELHSGRGLHTTSVESTLKRPADIETPSVIVKSRKTNVKDLVDMFERLSVSPPIQKRFRHSGSPSEVSTELSPSSEIRPDLFRTAGERLKASLLKPEEPEKIKKDQRDIIVVKITKREHIPVQLAVRRLEAVRPTASQEKISGFANLGNTCYMNAMLQGLFSMDIFARDLFKFCKKIQTCEVDLEKVMPMSLALSNLASMRDRVSSCEKRELLAAVKDVSRFKGNAQQDANEFLVHVLNQVYEECDELLREQCGITNITERRMQNPVMANFAFTMQNTIICNMCHNVSQTDEDSIILPVTINVLDQASGRLSRKFSRFPSVQTLLDEFFKTENIERKCELCQGESGQRTQKIVQLPRCLIIFIKRYVYDVSRSVKRTDQIDIPLYLTLDGHCVESPAPFLAISPSTKKIDFVSASPIKKKLLRMSVNTPSPARRRLKLSDKETSYDAQEVSAVEKTPNPMIVRTNTASQCNVDFVVPDGCSKLKNGDQVTEDFVKPWNSTKNAGESKSPSDLTCEKLSHVREKEELELVCERSMWQMDSNDEKESSDLSIEFFEAEAKEEDDKTEVQMDSRTENPEEKPNLDLRFFERVGGNRKIVQSTSRMEEEDITMTHLKFNYWTEFESIGFAGEIDMEKAVAVPNIGMDVERVRQGDCKVEPEFTEKSHTKSLVQSPVSSELQEKLLSTEDEKEPTRPSTPVPPNIPIWTAKQYQEKKSRESSPSTSDSKEILEEFSVQVVPYKPLSAEKRRTICSQIGLLFIHDCIEKTSIRLMSLNDYPSRVAGIIGDGNCLFRALAFYFAGSDIEHSRVRESIVEFEAEHWIEFAALKGWSSEAWNDHMNNLLTDSTWGTEIELFAIAAMLSVDVWTYYDQRWICYRPRFKIQNGDAIRISIADYRLGVNDGIYLLNESNHFTPMLKPSNTLLVEDADERVCNLVVNANEGFMKPSYRLLSVISHLGQTSESGHYICDAWCKKSKGWLFCDDETVSTISETRVRSRNDVGYIYFYLNRTLFESEDA